MMSMVHTHGDALTCSAAQIRMVPNRTLNSVLTVLLRFSNTLIGSAHWIWTAKSLGLQ
jgi:hypothetical protein